MRDAVGNWGGGDGGWREREWRRYTWMVNSLGVVGMDVSFVGGIRMSKVWRYSVDGVVQEVF